MTMVFSQLILLYQTGLFQYCQRPVDSGQADIWITDFCPVIEGFGIQVPLAFLQDLQHQLALRCQPVTTQADISNGLCLLNHKPLIENVSHFQL